MNFIDQFVLNKICFDKLDPFLKTMLVNPSIKVGTTLSYLLHNSFPFEALLLHKTKA